MLKTLYHFDLQNEISKNLVCIGSSKKPNKKNNIYIIL